MSKNRDLKSQKVADIKTRVQNAKAMVITDHTGLKVSQISELRSKIKAAGGDYAVTKNTLLRLGMSLSKSDDSVMVKSLNGPTAVLFSIGDEIAPIKALTQFIKANGLPNIKIGILGDKAISAEEVNKLSTLPTREILIGKLLGLFKAPMTNLTYVLNGNTSKLVRVLSEINKQKAN